MSASSAKSFFIYMLLFSNLNVLSILSVECGPLPTDFFCFLCSGEKRVNISQEIYGG
jgi:hypothetical protein